MRTILKKTVHLETKRHDFENEFSYIEVWSNAHLKDCYFVQKDFLFPDGTLKHGGVKYFYSKYTGEDVEKEIKSVNCDTFDCFDRLFYYDEEGETIRIDGVSSLDLESEFLNKK